MKYKFEFNNVDSLLILRGLDYILADKDTRPVDSKEATKIRDYIFQVVRESKNKKYKE